MTDYSRMVPKTELAQALAAMTEASIRVGATAGVAGMAVATQAMAATLLHPEWAWAHIGAFLSTLSQSADDLVALTPVARLDGEAEL